MNEQLVRYLAIEKALQIEMKATPEQNNQQYVRGCAQPDEEINKNKAKITVTYDMGCHDKSSGRRYESYRGHTLIIGGVSKGFIGMVLY